MAIPTSKKYVDYEGLKEYHKLLQQWVKNAIEEAKSDIEADLDVIVDDKIIKAFQAAHDAGTVDDIRTFSSVSDFPVPGTIGVQYVDDSTGIEYQWVEDATEPDGGHYIQINSIASKEDIGDLF